MNFDKDLSIDKLSLDEEWLKQPQLYFRYAEKAEDASAEMTKAKDKLALVKAEADNAARETLSRGDKKVTENMVTSEVLQSSKYQEALNEFNAANYNYGVLQSAVKAFDHKKAALENLVRLQLGGYFSSPTEPREKKTTFKEDKFDDVQSEKLNRKRGK